MKAAPKAGASQGKDAPSQAIKQQTTLSSFFSKGPAAVKPAAATPVKAPATPATPRLGENDAAASQARTQSLSSNAKTATHTTPAKSSAKKPRLDADAMDICVGDGVEELTVQTHGTEKGRARKRVVQGSDESESEDLPQRSRRRVARASLKEASSSEDEEADGVCPLSILCGGKSILSILSLTGRAGCAGGVGRRARLAFCG